MDIEKCMSEDVRIIEEAYARKLTQRDIRVSFTDGDYSYTDGHVIIVNPKLGDLYKDTKALRDTELILNIKPYFSGDEYNAARLITRLQVIHECLHINYSEFPSRVIMDEYAHNMDSRFTLQIINEIIEDSYIENVGCTISKTLELNLKFYRLLLMHRFLKDENTSEENNPNMIRLNSYLVYMAKFVLYPMIEQKMPEDISDYVENTKELFLIGAITSNPEKRYEYTRRVYEVIEELFRENEPAKKDVSGGSNGNSIGAKDQDNERKVKTNYEDNGKKEKREELNRYLGKSKTHSDALTDKKNTPKEEQSEPQKKLFDDNNNQESDSIYKELFDFEETLQNTTEWIRPKNLGCSSLHTDINLKVIRTRHYTGGRNQYNEIYRKNKSCIDNYRSRFYEFLHAETETVVDRCLVGHGIDSSNFYDVKKRYWYRTYREDDIPSIGIIVMIDCSYSMEGIRMKAVKEAAVMINEVLKNQGIDYAIFGHTAIVRKPEVEHQIFVDFNSTDNDKYNLMLLQGLEGSREGVSLMWANQYLKDNSDAENKVIIVISDGEPIHYVGRNNCYEAPESISDAADAVKKIKKSGIDVIAIALDDGKDPCYDRLSLIYPNTIECNKLSKLPQQVLEIIGREIRK